MQEVQVAGEHISHIHTDNIQGVENATIRHEDVTTPTQTSIDMYQSQTYEENVSQTLQNKIFSTYRFYISNLQLCND